MRKPKLHYYIALVGEEKQFRFVTKIQTEPRKVAEWVATDKPLEFASWEQANQVAMGLIFHGTWAFVVANSFELEEPIFKEENQCPGKKNPAIITNL